MRANIFDISFRYSTSNNNNNTMVPRIEVLFAFCCQLRNMLNRINRIANFPTVIAFIANIFRFIMNIGMSIVWITNGIKSSGSSLSLKDCFFFLCFPMGFFFFVLIGLECPEWPECPLSASAVINITVIIIIIINKSFNEWT